MTSVIPFKFQESVEVRTVSDSQGEVLFVGKDVAAALGYADHTNAMKQHCRGVVKHHPILDSLGRTQEARVLTEADVLRLIVNSKLPAAEAFERWVFEEVLPRIRKTGSYTMQPAQPILHTPLIEDLAAIDVLARMLNVAPSGKVIMARTVLQQSAPHLIPALPGYTVDAPRDVVVANGSAMPTASATDLLKRHNVKMSTAKFNELLENRRLLNRCERITSRGDYKGFWSVTVEGEEYGKNLVSAQNTRETQPHWYVERFGALLKAVGVTA